MITLTTDVVPALLHVESEDGIRFGTKEEAISWTDYPENYTCHIRDPKVWKDGEEYHMILGAARKATKVQFFFINLRI